MEQLNNYHIIELIGSGANAIVYKVLYEDTIYAVKIQKKTRRSRKQIYAEKNGLLTLSESDFFPKLFMSQIVEHYSIMIMEYVAGHTLNVYKNLSHEEISHIMVQLVLILQYLEKYNACHRDIKPENIIAKWVNGFPIIKLVDFGYYTTNKKQLLGSGTPHYLPPELITDKNTIQSGSDQDLWAIGVILFELYTGNLPFTESGMVKFMKYMDGYQHMDHNNVLKYHNLLWKKKNPNLRLIPDTAKDLFYNLTYPKLEKRIKLQNLPQHKYFSDTNFAEYAQSLKPYHAQMVNDDIIKPTNEKIYKHLNDKMNLEYIVDSLNDSIDDLQEYYQLDHNNCDDFAFKI